MSRNRSKKVREVMEKPWRLGRTVKEETIHVLDAIKVKCDECGAIMGMQGIYFPT
jgi:hypothetical protein